MTPADGGSPVVPLPYSEKELSSSLGEKWKERLSDAYSWMLLGRLLDSSLAMLQRSGAVGPSYGAPTGHEAANVGAALALEKADWVFPGLREQLVAMVRGMTLASYMHSLFGNAMDSSQGRQVPALLSSREAGFVSVPSSVGAQIVQGTGCAYAMRYRKDKGITVIFFGDGATSEGDFHSGMNFAGVYRLPVLFLCINNQWAISLPVEKQSAMSEMARKAEAYGFKGRRIDGTDVVAVYLAVKEARQSLLKGDCPQMIEAVLYRMPGVPSEGGAPSFLPDGWKREAASHDPLARLEELLERTGALPLAARQEIRKGHEERIRRAINEAEATPPPSPDSLFRDTTGEAYWPLTEERDTFDRDQGGHFP
jgi:2-oxoisovalerate dehydrogenase E1 component alpha subunit